MLLLLRQTKSDLFIINLFNLIKETADHILIYSTVLCNY